MRHLFLPLILLLASCRNDNGLSSRLPYNGTERVSSSGGYERYNAYDNAWYPAPTTETSGSMTGPGNH